jgi:hypothetical protein
LQIGGMRQHTGDAVLDCQAVGIARPRAQRGSHCIRRFMGREIGKG